MTKKNLQNAINRPFDQMLTALAGISGYDEYVEWLSQRVNVDLSWQAEIISLFEVNKENHPLLRISGHDHNEPEGIFQISGEVGILEAAYIKYKFDENEEKRRCENVCTGFFHSVSETITENGWLVIIVNSVNVTPSIGVPILSKAT